jgi:SAM-dependent methyltransferase
MTEYLTRTSKFFDAYAGDFSAIYGNENTGLDRLVNRLFRRAMFVRYQKTLAGCQQLSERTVIDVGCGPGLYSVALAKGGAKFVYGLDFAPRMIELARENAASAGVAAQCRFEFGDFLTHPIEGVFDYAVVMGFMDYAPNPEDVVKRVLGLTSRCAFFSFPMDGGILAWQRKVRYRNRCELYMYTYPQLSRLFAGLTDKAVVIEDIGRDSFVTVEMEPDGR